MILSGLEIKKRLGSTVFIEPFDEGLLNPNSYNLRLHDRLLVYRERELDMKKTNEVREVAVPAEEMVLEPGTLYLGRSLEYTRTEGLVPMLGGGRSSVGRLGLYVHVTVGFGDVGFAGYWTLEMYCVQPVRIYPGVQICQIYYHTIEGPYRSYADSGKYQGNAGAQPCRRATRPRAPPTARPRPEPSARHRWQGPRSGPCRPAPRWPRPTRRGTTPRPWHRTCAH